MHSHWVWFWAGAAAMATWFICGVSLVAWLGSRSRGGWGDE